MCLPQALWSGCQGPISFSRTGPGLAQPLTSGDEHSCLELSSVPSLPAVPSFHSCGLLTLLLFPETEDVSVAGTRVHVSATGILPGCPRPSVLGSGSCHWALLPSRSVT